MKNRACPGNHRTDPMSDGFGRNPRYLWTRKAGLQRKPQPGQRRKRWRGGCVYAPGRQRSEQSATTKVAASAEDTAGWSQRITSKVAKSPRNDSNFHTSWLETLGKPWRTGEGLGDRDAPRETIEAGCDSETNDRRQVRGRSRESGSHDSGMRRRLWHF